MEKFVKNYISSLKLGKTKQSLFLSLRRGNLCLLVVDRNTAFPGDEAISPPYLQKFIKGVSNGNQ
jgi:hypothetical protein